MPDGKAYSNFTEFCQAGGVEFDAVNTGKGFEVKQSLPFWENPADSQANSKRADILVETYNKVANVTSSNMSPLPTIANLTSTNPPCYESTPECVNAKYGCMRTLYSQMCLPCLKHASGCAQPESTGFVFPGSK
ncbi:TPA: hypothetical protein N0F65_011960 [Lagenidium giganteum]|nr:TPA: hypothetical protein N0F65_011960 [Lagenidium giganteum]